MNQIPVLASRIQDSDLVSVDDCLVARHLDQASKRLFTTPLIPKSSPRLNTLYPFTEPDGVNSAYSTAYAESVGAETTATQSLSYDSTDNCRPLNIAVFMLFFSIPFVSGDLSFGPPTTGPLSLASAAPTPFVDAPLSQRLESFS
jgi:hypothetical protein